MQVLSLVLLSAVAMTSQAAGFNCKKAKLFVEKAICQDASLSALDEELVYVFNEAVTNSDSPKTLKKQQTNWLKTKRNKCQTNSCLEKVYKERIAVFRKAAANLPSPDSPNPVKTTEYVRYGANDKPDYHAASLTIYELQGKIKVTGTASWVGDATTGNVNTGSVDGTFDLQGDQIHYKDDSGCEFVMLIGKNALTVNHDNGQCGGANVTFDGYYKKVK
jgi:uncharacterized protein